MKTAKQLREKMSLSLRTDRLGASWWTKGWNARRDGADRYDGMPFKDMGGHKNRLRMHWLDGWDIANAEMIIEQGNREFNAIEPGTVLIHSIGCGCDEFYQVTRRAAKTVWARKLKYEVTARNLELQTCKVSPVKGSFDVGAHDEFVKLGLKLDPRGSLQIGPVRRLIWWNIWDGKARDQWSS